MSDFTVAAFVVGDQYMTSETTRKISSMFVGDEDVTIRCADLDATVDELMNPPFFGNKVILVELASISKDDVESVKGVADRCSSSCLAIISAKSLSPQAKKIITKEVGEPVFRFFSFSKNPSEREAASFIYKRVRDAGGSISKTDATYMASVVGADYWMLSQEVDKIMSVDKKISRDNIDKYSFPSSSCEYFKLYSYLGNGNAIMALKEARALVDGFGFEPVDNAIMKVMSACVRSASTGYTACVDVEPHRLNESTWWPDGKKSGNPMPTKFMVDIVDEIVHRHGRNGVESIMRFIIDDVATGRLFPDTRHIIGIETKILAICGKNGCPKLTG